MTTALPLSVNEASARGAADTVREITQQPTVWREVFGYVASNREMIDTFLKPILEKEGLRIILTGAGTSAFAGKMLTPVLSASLERPVEAAATTDIVSRPAECFPAPHPVLLVSFARSGNSPESIAATQLADKLSSECYHLIITCNPEGRLHQEHHADARSLVLMMPAMADDQGFAMTSSVTAMMLAVLGALSPERVHAEVVERIISATQDILTSAVNSIKQQAENKFQRVVYLGSGVFNSLAQESALKMLELTAGMTLSYNDTPLGFRHGPKALLDDKTLVLVFVSNDPYARRYDLDILEELANQPGSGSVIAITASELDGHSLDGVWKANGLSKDGDWALLFPYLVYAQVLALHSSLALGKTPDNPFPSGEVNRVVQGVTIHPFEIGTLGI
ncbi:SIS domain-containing protein [Halomonas sp. HP20-15]|uniref:SIS domain-containing protein n=1 Tax=Halomonas sp. HP20-15 TaxID=3085901 RepID=UPI00298258E5|nr:SIS domain-containing protein [Halomonas sp. HP20-15]MDW5377527.1 SIS domain-containing protein [Halomonas sp. HP20-15]